MKNIRLYCCLTLLISLLLISTAYGAAHKDIRILIDVSGSMKQNDPHNLRIPALRLLTELLPDGAQAGVWTFGRYVNMLVPHGQVDATWRKKALRAAEKISAHGLDTNIEDSFKEATWDWSRPDNNTRRSIILLTDGYVDIARNQEKSTASRHRILNELLPKLQQAGVAINTIALSDNADKKLLRQLATITNGLYQQTASAEKLERIFFRLFERATQPDTLPLENNTILVDDSVREMTLLVFRHAHAPVTSLTAPSGDVIDHENLPTEVRWHQEDHYDLITIGHPATGTWKLAAERDPDNRAMIVTRLRAIATQLPGNISLGDHFTLFVNLTDNGRVIKKKEFLHFIKVTVTQESDTGEHQEWLLLDNGRGNDKIAGDGTYTLLLDSSLILGHHKLQVSIDGTTFKRSQGQMFNIYDSPLATSIEADKSAPDDAYLLDILPRAGMIDPDSIHLTATTMTNGETLETLDVPRVNHSEWRLKLSNYPAGRRYQLRIDLRGRKPDGKALHRTLNPLDFGVVRKPSKIAATEPSAAEKSPAEETPSPNEQPAIEDKPAANWWLVIVQVLLLNALIIGGLFFSYKRWFSIAPPQIPEDWQEALQE